jgi:CelD/BcsL family acetyltransferase involved in cellulose biosynthesis
MRIEVVTSGERLRQIGAAWDVLWTRSRGSVFQSHRWIMAWWDECPHPLRIACAWQDRELIAVLPLCIHRWYGIRVLEWTAQPYSDYCDTLMTAVDPTLLDWMWSVITASGGYDLVRLKHVRHDSIVKPLLDRIGEKERDEICLQVACEWDSGEAWYKTLNKKTRNNHSRGGRILREFGAYRFRQLGPDEPLAPVIGRLIALKRKWEDNRGSPMVRSDTILLALGQALQGLCSLRVYLIEHEGTIIAGSVNAMDGNKMLALFATYDPTYERASPGILLMTEYTKLAFDRGVAEVDYLLGAESYKYKFANRQTKLHIYLAAGTLAGRLALAACRQIQRRTRPDPVISIGSAYLTEKGSIRTPNVLQGRHTTRGQSTVHPKSQQLSR